MILDIEGKEINVGDEVYCAFNNATMWKIRILKETDKSIHYKCQYKSDSWLPVGKKAGDWTEHKTYMHKTSHSFKNMLKV